MVTAIEADGFLLYRRGPRLARLVRRWDTTNSDVAAVTARIRHHAEIAATA